MVLSTHSRLPYVRRSTMNDFDYSPPRARGQIGESSILVRKAQETEPTTATTAVGPQPSQKVSPVTSSQSNTSPRNDPNLGNLLTAFVSQVATQIAEGVREFLDAVGQAVRTFVEKARHDYEAWTSDPLLQERPATLIGQVRQSKQPSDLPKYIQLPLAIVVFILLLLRFSTAGEASLTLIEINVESPQFYTNFDTLNQNCSTP